MNSLSKERVDQIIELRDAGYSIREIASEVDVPKSTVERALKTESQPSAPLAGSPQVLEIKLSELPAKENEKPAALTPDQLRLREREIDLSFEQIALEKHKIDAITRLSERSIEEKAERLESRKRLLVNKFNRLLKEFTDNCQDSTWDRDEVEDFINMGDTLMGKIRALCDSADIDEGGLAIWNHLDTLIGQMEDTLEKPGGFFRKAEIEFDLTDAERKEFEDYVITDFEEEYVEEVDEDGDGDDDEDEDQDDEDEDDEDEDDEDDEM